MAEKAAATGTQITTALTRAKSFEAQMLIGAALCAVATIMWCFAPDALGLGAGVLFFIGGVVYLVGRARSWWHYR